MEQSQVHSSNTQLKDRMLWYDGDSTVSEDEITRMLSIGMPVEGLFVDEVTSAIRQYNQLVDTNQQIRTKDKVGFIDLSWKLPPEYQSLDPQEYVINQLVSQDYDDGRAKRVADELALYKDLGLMDVLRTIIYIINTLSEKNAVWGVGRGSSVSSYVLYLIGVHDVDSYEYDLDISDFLRKP